MPQTTISPGLSFSGYIYNNIQSRDITVPVEIYKVKVTDEGNTCTYTELGQIEINLTRVNLEEYKANSNDPKDAFLFTSFDSLRQISVYCRSNYSSQQENSRFTGNQIKLKSD